MGKVFGLIEIRKSRAVPFHIHRGDMGEQTLNPMSVLVQ